MHLYAAVGCLLFSSVAAAQVPPASPAIAPQPPTPALAQSNPASAAIAPAPPHHWDSIVALIAAFGHDDQYDHDVLGFGTIVHPWAFRAIGINDDMIQNTGNRHSIAIGRGPDEDDVLVSVKEDGMTHWFRTNRDGQVVRAVSISMNFQKVAPMPTPDAQTELNAEFAFWDNNVNRITNWMACKAEMAGPNSVTPEKKIDACTALIQSGEESRSIVSVAYSERAYARRIHKNGTQIISDARMAVQLDPTSAFAWSQLCMEYISLHKDTRDALQACENANQLNPKDPDSWVFRGDIDLHAKKYDLAIANYNQALALQPKWMWPLTDRSDAYLLEGNLDRALEDDNEVIRLTPELPIGYMNRALVEMRKNDFKSALADFQAALKLEPDYGRGLFGQGLVEYDMGEKAQGRDDMAKGKKLDPTSARDFAKYSIPIP